MKAIEKENYDKVKLDFVYRKVRSEKLSCNVREKDDFFDVIQIQKDHPKIY